MKETMCKFHGKFSDLIPAGWRFNKLFARNYRVYSYDIPNTGKTVWIWQHHGGYIELDDCYGATNNVIKAALDDDKFPWKQFHEKLGGRKYKKMTLVREDNSVIPRDEYKHNGMFVMCKMEKEGKSEEEIDKITSIVCNSYKEVFLPEDAITFIKDMINRGWIKIG